MKITNLRIENFRGIEKAEIDNAGAAVVIAGPNGSGKSCVLDAIRLFKSAYGSYQQSEIDLWSNEFQLNSRGGSGDFRGLLRDKNRALLIEGEIEISKREKEFLLGEGQWMLQELAWKEKFPHAVTYQGQLRTIATPNMLEMVKVVHNTVQDWIEVLTTELKWRKARGHIEVKPSGNAGRGSSRALEIMFGFFVPEKMGIIDYHGSHRKYDREQLSTIALKESDEEEKVKSGALYNYETKYANLKAAMAGEYVRELLERDALGRRTGKIKPLAKTLEELFSMFLPGKTFKGPVAVEGGELAFPVWVGENTQHDINELSSGEKEILFAYLRARTLSPRQSVLLIDEPELHLNPGLVQGLPQFYEKHIGRDLENQIWLVTHSDRFLREALDTTGMMVYHMQHAKVASSTNQLIRIKSKTSVEGLFIDLVGDLAAYRPDGKVVFLESVDSKFDQKMVTRLFPEAAKSINFISGGSKTNVKRLQETIEAMAEHGQAQAEVFSIVDPDNEIWNRKTREQGTQLEWNKYHIENYLLEANFIKEAVGIVDLEGADRMSEVQIDRLLEDAAADLIEELAVQKVRDKIWRDFRKATEITINPDQKASEQLVAGITTAAKKVQSLKMEFGNEETTEILLEKERRLIREMWSDGLWRTKFPGRKILKRFCSKLHRNIEYIGLRNAIVGEMAKAGFQPKGMAKIIKKVEGS